MSALVYPALTGGARVRPTQYTKADESKLRALRTVFKAGGTVTAGNSSAISDGAAALVLASEARAAQLGLPVLARRGGAATACGVAGGLAT